MAKIRLCDIVTQEQWNADGPHPVVQLAWLGCWELAEYDISALEPAERDKIHLAVVNAQPCSDYDAKQAAACALYALAKDGGWLDLMRITWDVAPDE